MKITEEGDTLLATTKEEEKAPKMTVMERLAAIKDALSMGAITQKDARDIKMRMGLGQAYFTRKQTTVAKRKRKRKLEKLARRANRGQKGSNLKGARFRINNSAAK